MKVLLRRTGLALALLVAGIQLWPVGRTNPAVTADLRAAPEVQRILRKSCYDCHSNETRWPWYAYVAPVSWLVVHDVKEGRDELNFSSWEELSPQRKKRRAEKAIDEIEEGRALFKSRVTPEIYGMNIYERALVDVMLKSKGHVKSKIW